MDISWTGMGIGYNGDNNWTDGPFPHRVSEVPGTTYEGAATFIGALTTPGCKWRFRNDPEATLYTTEAWLQTQENRYGCGK